MNTQTIIGGIVIAILLISVVYAFVSPVVYKPPVPEVPEKVISNYTLVRQQEPEVEYVNLNMTIKAGGFNITFSSDSNLIYHFKFEQDKNVTKPIVENRTLGNGLMVNVFAETGDLEATFGSNYLYNGTIKVGVGGLSLVLSKYSNVDNFDIVAMYAGGISLEVLDEASFNHLDLKATLGGIMMRVNASSLIKNCNITARVEVGGYMIEPISVGVDLGLKLAAFVDIGGIMLNPAGLQKVKEEVNEIEIRTLNYATATTKLDIEIFVGLGGAMINQSFLGTLPIS
jgi:hypothetical protein